MLCIFRSWAMKDFFPIAYGSGLVGRRIVNCSESARANMANYTTAEAAEQLKITKRSIARLIRDKKIAANWNAYARRFEIEESEVERYKSERRTVGRPLINPRARQGRREG